MCIVNRVTTKAGALQSESFLGRLLGHAFGEFDSDYIDYACDCGSTKSGVQQ